MLIVDKHKWYEFPESVAVCPICGAKVLARFDEWESETGRVTETGFHLECISEPDIDDDGWDDWVNSHYQMPYVDWMPLEGKCYVWFDKRYRVTP